MKPIVLEAVEWDREPTPSQMVGTLEQIETFLARSAASLMDAEMLKPADSRLMALYNMAVGARAAIDAFAGSSQALAKLQVVR